MPYCRDISTSRSVRSFWPTWMSSLSAMASISSWVLTAFSALVRLSASNSSRLLPCCFERLGELRLVVVEPVDRVVQRVVDLRLHDLLGQRDLDLLEQRLERLVADLLGLLDALDPLDLLGEAVLELVDGVEFACQLGEFVVGLGQLAFLDGLDGDGHLRLLAGVLTGGQRGGEDAGLPLLEADDRVVETLDQLAGADLVGQPLGRWPRARPRRRRWPTGRWRRSRRSRRRARHR